MNPFMKHTLAYTFWDWYISLYFWGIIYASFFSEIRRN